MTGCHDSPTDSDVIILREVSLMGNETKRLEVTEKPTKGIETSCYTEFRNEIVEDIPAHAYEPYQYSQWNIGRYKILQRFSMKYSKA